MSRIDDQPLLHVPAYDGTGNILAFYDTANGQKAAEYEYGPFGEALRATGPMAKGNPFRWSTKYTDDETGLVYYGWRYYSPTAGRWLGRDPMAEEMSLYLYVNFGGGSLSAATINSLLYSNDYLFLANQPTSKTDLLGLIDWGGAKPPPNYRPEDANTSKGNCWRYACNDPKGDNEPHFPPAPPGYDPSNKGNTCEKFMGGLRGLPGVKSPAPWADGCPCPKGSRLTAALLTNSVRLPDGSFADNYHFMVQNGNSWDHKQGQLQEEHWNGTPEQWAAQNFRKYKVCGYICLPEGFNTDQRR